MEIADGPHPHGDARSSDGPADTVDAHVASDAEPGPSDRPGMPSDDSQQHDALERLRARLEDVDVTPLDQRTTLFEEANALLVAELAVLDEV